MKYTIQLFLFMFCLSLYGQAKFPKDAVLLGIKGKIKTMTQINKVNQIEGMFSAPEFYKTIYHFDKKGRIKNIEFYAQKESKGKILTYNYTRDNSRALVHTSEDSKDTLRTEYFEVNKPYGFFVTSKSAKDMENGMSTSTTKKQEYNTSYRLTHSTEETIASKDAMKMKIVMNQMYTYEEDNLVQMRGIFNQQMLDDNMGPRTVRTAEEYIYYKNHKLDEFGNLIFVELLDKDKRLIGTEEKTYEYY